MRSTEATRLFWVIYVTDTKKKSAQNAPSLPGALERQERPEKESDQVETEHDTQNVNDKAELMVFLQIPKFVASPSRRNKSQI